MKDCVCVFLASGYDWVTVSNERLKRIKEENINVIKGKNHLDGEASITNMIMNPHKEWLACKKTHHLT